jgi:glycolate oxidase FAD binding subunit
MGEVTIKVMPLPETQLTIGIEGLTHEEAIKAMTAALQSAAEVSGAAYVPPHPGAAQSRTMLRLEGIEASVMARSELLEGLLKPFGALCVLDDAGSRALWLEIRDAAPLAALAEAYIWRLSVPTTESARIAAQVSAGSGAHYYCDWGGGLIWLAVPPAPDAYAATIRGALGAGGGHATLIRAPANVRQLVAVFEPQQEALGELTRRVKLSFDPARVLNRGRMYEGI